MIFKWLITGTEIPASPGSMVHHFEDSGEREAESAGEIVEWLAQRGPWDMLDGRQRVAIDIEPAPTLPDPDPTWESIQRNARASMYETPGGSDD